jgi:hypothetical protein
MRLLSPLALLPIVSVVAGCAAAQNTLAQDLAWARVQSCKRFSTVNVDRVDPNGTVWVSYQSPGEHRLWVDCMTEAAKKQGSSVAMLPPVAATPASEVANAFPASAPLWKPGFEWAYRYDSPAGSGTYVSTVDREELVGGTRYWVLKAGTINTFYRASDLASSHETVGGVLVYKYDPPRLHFKWPLSPGVTWEQTIKSERPQDRTTSEVNHAWTVEAQETVTVPAGTFQAVKIVERNKRTGRIVSELWYSPAAMKWVRLREVLANGEQNRELIALKVK